MKKRKWLRWYLSIVVFLFGLFLQADLHAFTLRVVGPDGNPIANGYRWLLEEDATWQVTPGNPATNWAIDFHKSYMPVAAKGVATGETIITPPDAAKYYYVSVLPDRAAGTNYSLGGARVEPGQAVVTVCVNPLPIPTAQIVVFVFEDNFPINNAPDQPAEFGLPGFTVLVEDAGGRYGISAGAQTMDAFGNMLGTIYQKNPDGSFVLDGEGNPIPAGWQPLVTGPCPGENCGMLTIKNLAPGKYGISVVPPPGTDWQQTSTIEGTKIIDAWVKANEPAYFQEFGPPGPHVFIGFVRPMNDTTVLTGGTTITGQVVNQHLSRPPDYGFYDGAPFPHTTAWVGLNEGPGGRGLYAQPCDGEGNFSIPNVPPGNYQLVVWDENLDVIFSFLGITVNPDNTCATPNGTCDLGHVPVFQWFIRQEHHVFNDVNGNGIWDVGEPPLAGQAVNLRWRDGTVYQSFTTDNMGFVPFDEIFPFFSWQVAEVDFTRLKATGVTVIVDAGGPIDPMDPLTFEGQLNPQAQFCSQADIDAGTIAGVGADGIGGTADDVLCTTIGQPIISPYSNNNFARTEYGPVLTQAFQGFLGQTSVFMWGKQAYRFGENGGISGIVYYSTTRAENDPEQGAAEPWEPGIPRVTVRLWGIGPDRIPNTADDILLNEIQTDSWDDNVPTGCPGDPTDSFYLGGKCYDGMRNWNQVRPGVFDGGYAFTTCWRVNGIGPCVTPDTANAVGAPLAGGEYVVEVIPPPGYEVVKSQDKNVDFGDNYVPSLLAQQNLPPCVGALYNVPETLSLFPGEVIHPFYDSTSPYFVGAYDPANPAQLNLCDKKFVRLSGGENGVADFFLFTEVPIAGHIVGFILDDMSNEFDPNSPQFGEKYAPPWLPVSIHDWTGRELSRTYSDQWGRYNALVPSTYTANLPQPSGMSPNMITVCLNTPVKPNPNYNPADPASPQFIEEPFFNPQYSQFCYTFQYMPGTTTYLDTPVIPVAAFAGPDQFPLDCEFPNGTPVIRYVTNLQNQGPYVSVANGTQRLTVISQGTVQVPNPAFCDPLVTTCPPGSDTVNVSIPRDYGFGTARGTVRIGNTTIPNPNIEVWNPNQITFRVPAAVTTGQLTITRGGANGRSTITGVMITVGGPAPIIVSKTAAGAHRTIQAAIDAAPVNSLITVAPGTYDEIVLMWKPVKLQGWGSGSTKINAVKVPAEKLQAWRNKARSLIDPNGDGNPVDGAIDLLPSQEVLFNANPALEPVTLFKEEGSAILVLAKADGPNRFRRVNGQPNSRIDGFTVTGADHAGGIVVNGYARFLEISNNRVSGNMGFFGGGIRVGHPTLTVETDAGINYQDGFNDNIAIHNNHITQNAGLNGAGGGVSLCTGSDSYLVAENFICGNFTTGVGGGGIGHLGLSRGGEILDNTIIFNESFNQGTTAHGGGILIAGGVPLGGPGSLSPGSGSVRIDGNLIQGNYAGAGDGGGIRTQDVNGQDVAASPDDQSNWYLISIFNNMIVNNVTGLAGGGISMQDTARIRIIHNTLTHNDGAAVAGSSFAPGSPNQSTPQPAGIVSRAHSNALNAVIGAVPPRFQAPFSNPRLVNNIIWENRSFYFFGDPFADPPVYGLLPVINPDGTGAVYWDLAVLGTQTPEYLNPQYSILTSLSDYTVTAGPTGPVMNPTGFSYAPSNLSADPRFVAEYFNGNRGQTITNEFTTVIQAPPAFDEGGNYIKLRFGPLTLTVPGTSNLYGDYHIRNNSPAEQNGLNVVIPALATDFDDEPRPIPFFADPDIGADERR